MIEYMYGKKRVEGIVMKKKYMAILILCLLGSNCFLAACGVNLEATIPPSQMKMQKQEMLHNDSVEKVEEVAVIQIQPVSINAQVRCVFLPLQEPAHPLLPW